MNDFGQPGNVHLKGPSWWMCVCCWVEVLFDEVEVEEVVVRRGARCFLEMCPVRAASEAKSAESQSCQLHLVTPLVRWRAFKCFLRSVPVAKLAPQTVPQGMIHWQAREVLGAFTAKSRSDVVLKASLGGSVEVIGLGSGFGVAVKSMELAVLNGGTGPC